MCVCSCVHFPFLITKILTSGNLFVNKQSYTLVGRTFKRLVQDTLAVTHLNNRLCSQNVAANAGVLSVYLATILYDSSVVH